MLLRNLLTVMLKLLYHTGLWVFLFIKYVLKIVPRNYGSVYIYTDAFTISSIHIE